MADIAVKVEDVVLRVLAELKPGRVIKTNVEYYAAAVLQGVGLAPEVFRPPSRWPATPARPRTDRAGLREQADPTGHALHRPARQGPARLSTQRPAARTSYR